MARTNIEAKLVRDLVSLAKRGIDRVFEPPKGMDPLETEFLLDVVAHLHPNEWCGDNNQKTSALRKTIRAAIELTPTSKYPNTDVSWQHIAYRLYDFVDEAPIDPEYENTYTGKKPSRYSLLIHVLRQETGWLGGTNFERLTGPIRNRLAAKLLELEKSATSAMPPRELRHDHGHEHVETGSAATDSAWHASFAWLISS